MGQERRVYSRISEDIGVAVSVMRETGPIPLLRSPAFHLTSDISEGGLRFRNDRPIEAGTLLKVYVALKTPLLTLTQFARVCWARPGAEGEGCDVGIQFTDASESDRLSWSHYVQQALAASAH